MATAAGVRVTWKAPGAEFRVFRKVEGADYALAATVQKPEWLDTTAEFGKPYSYMVQTIARQDKPSPKATSRKPVSSRRSTPSPGHAQRIPRLHRAQFASS